jgi:hypothetical protein
MHYGNAVGVFILLHRFEVYIFMYVFIGAHGSLVVKALCYKPEGRGFETG